MNATLIDPRTFHLGDILSITTGELFAPTYLAGVDALLTHLVGTRPASDIEAIEAMSRARDALYAQFPWLTHVVLTDSTDRNELCTWFCHQVVERGAYHSVLGVPPIVDAEIVEETPAEEVTTGVTSE